jgi:osmotically-inducible protein OsmY
VSTRIGALGISPYGVPRCLGEPYSEMSDATARTFETLEHEIRQLVASAAEREGICVSVEIDRGQVTLRGDVVCQEALGEIADSLLSFATVKQVHTRISAAAQAAAQGS